MDCSVKRKQILEELKSYGIDSNANYRRFNSNTLKNKTKEKYRKYYQNVTDEEIEEILNSTKSYKHLKHKYQQDGE